MQWSPEMGDRVPGLLKDRFVKNMSRHEGIAWVDVLGGLMDSYRTGKPYDVPVIIESEQLENSGFQIAARFSDGSPAGSSGEHHCENRV